MTAVEIRNGSNEPLRKEPWQYEILKYAVDHGRNYGDARPARHVRVPYGSIRPLINMGFGVGID